MEILKYPHPHLLKPCKDVVVFGEELRVLLDAMWETMKDSAGVGLAANQVGLSFRMFTMEGPNQEKFYIVNPKILRRSAISANLKEGCLSAPGEFIVLSERSFWVEVQYQDESGKETKRVFQGLHAVCAQHEMDHLDGKSHLQSKTIPKSKRQELANKWGFKK